MKRRIIEITEQLEKYLVTIMDSALKHSGFSLHTAIMDIRNSIKEEEIPLAKPHTEILPQCQA